MPFFLLLQVRRVTAGELYMNPGSNTLIFRVAGGRTPARVSPLPFRLGRESNLCWRWHGRSVWCEWWEEPLNHLDCLPKLFWIIACATRYAARPSPSSQGMTARMSSTLSSATLSHNCPTVCIVLDIFSSPCCGVSLNTNVAFDEQHVAFLTHFERISPSLQSNILIRPTAYSESTKPVKLSNFIPQRATVINEAARDINTSVQMIYIWIRTL